jgi:hypothetical protein
MSDTPFLVRFGATVGVATLAALVAATPGAFRLSAAGDVDAVRAWLTLAGLLLLPMLALVPLARAARDGLRALTPSEGSRGLERLASAALMVCTWLWSLSIVGAVLREKTHQRALGAVTLAVVAIVTLAFLALVARRLVTLFVVLRERRLAVGTLVTVTAIVLSLVLLGARIARAAPDLTLGGRATLVDGLAIALTVAFAARKTFEDRRILAWMGPPAAVCLFVVSMHTLVTSVPAMITLEQACPVYFALLRGFARLT